MPQQIDRDSLLQRVNILDVVERDLGAPVRHSGARYLFHCPGPNHSHGDRHPSLGIDMKLQRAFCHVCGFGYNAIDWLMWRERLTFVEACQELAQRFGLDLTLASTSAANDSGRPPAPAEDAPPCAAWQARGWELMKQTEAILHMPAGERARCWLEQQRMLDQSTWERWRLGFIPDDYHEPFERWGLPSDFEKPGVWLPRGILIPTFTDDGQLWALHVRRASGKPKYPHIRGSKKSLWGSQNCDRRIVMLTGGELDGLLCQQEAAHIMGFASPSTGEGSTWSSTWTQYLMGADMLLCGYDADEAGQASAWKHVFSQSGRVCIATAPSVAYTWHGQAAMSKDWTDYAQARGRDGLRRRLSEHYEAALVGDTPEVLLERMNHLHGVKEQRYEFYLDLQTRFEILTERTNEL